MIRIGDEVREALAAAPSSRSRRPSSPTAFRPAKASRSASNPSDRCARRVRSRRRSASSTARSRRADRGGARPLRPGRRARPGRATSQPRRFRARSGPRPSAARLRLRELPGSGFSRRAASAASTAASPILPTSRPISRNSREPLPSSSRPASSRCSTSRRPPSCSSRSACRYSGSASNVPSVLCRGGRPTGLGPRRVGGGGGRGRRGALATRRLRPLAREAAGRAARGHRTARRGGAGGRRSSGSQRPGRGTALRAADRADARQGRRRLPDGRRLAVRAEVGRLSCDRVPGRRRGLHPVRDLKPLDRYFPELGTPLRARSRSAASSTARSSSPATAGSSSMRCCCASIRPRRG